MQFIAPSSPALRKKGELLNDNEHTRCLLMAFGDLTTNLGLDRSVSAGSQVTDELEESRPVDCFQEAKFKLR
jgi:hypothetical protein